MRHLILDHAAKEHGGKATERVRLIGEVSEEQIANWKSANKLGIYNVVSENGHVAYFKNPTIHEVNAALNNNKNSLDPIQEFLKITFLGGSNEMLNNDTMLLGAMNAAKVKIDGMRATLVNL